MPYLDLSRMERDVTTPNLPQKVVTFRHKVIPSQTGLRLDAAIFEGGIGLSRRKIKHIIDIGGCYVNRKRVRIASRKVTAGDQISLEYREESFSIQKDELYPLNNEHIVYHEFNILALNKPAGLVAQATRTQAVQHAGVSVKEFVKRKNIPFDDIYQIHRLDRETSGLMLFATQKKVALWLAEEFKERHVRKTYLAVCFGIPKTDSFEVSCRLSPIDKNTSRVRVVSEHGKESKTQFHVLAVNKELKTSLLSCHPVTGRTHQIRVHLASQNLPIFGDKLYDTEIRYSLSDELKLLLSQRHYLHAFKLKFRPSASLDYASITAPFDKNFQKVLEILFKENFTHLYEEKEEQI